MSDTLYTRDDVLRAALKAADEGRAYGKQTPNWAQAASEKCLKAAEVYRKIAEAMPSY